MAHRANSPVPNPATATALDFHFVERNAWQSNIDPLIADLAKSTGSQLHRHRAKIGRWALEYVGDDEMVYQFFSHHWPSARANETPDAYCYHFGQPAAREHLGHSDQPSVLLPQCTICPESRRAVLLGTHRYVHVYEACQEILHQLDAHAVRLSRTGQLQRPSDAWLQLRAACVEYQPSAGPTRTALLLGGRRTGKSVHGIGLCLANAGNGLIGDDLTCVHLGTGTAHRTETHLWWPTALVATYPHLAPFFATGPSEGLQLSEVLSKQVRNCRNATDLTRAVEGGLFPEDSFASLIDHLSRAADSYGVIDPHELLGHDRCLEQSQLTDALCVSRDSASPWILRVLSGAEFAARSIVAGVVTTTVEHTEPIEQPLKACLKYLVDESEIRPVLLNSRLPAAQTQFCLRHYLEGTSDSIQILSARDFADTSLLRAMRLGLRHCEHDFGPGRQELSFFHGTRTVNLVSFERTGSRVELVAFDPSEEGYAQVRAVWPGQVADFFSRHASLHVREVFTETRNSFLERT